MFPGAGATVYYNEDGEPLGWDAASSYDDEPDAYEEYDGPDEWEDDEEDPDADEDCDLDGPGHVREDESLAAEFRSAERLLR
jgi:hypothetical protein